MRETRATINAKIMASMSVNKEVCTVIVAAFVLPVVDS